MPCRSQPPGDSTPKGLAPASVDAGERRAADRTRWLDHRYRDEQGFWHQKPGAHGSPYDAPPGGQLIWDPAQPAGLDFNIAVVLALALARPPQIPLPDDADGALEFAALRQIRGAMGLGAQPDASGVEAALRRHRGPVMVAAGDLILVIPDAGPRRLQQVSHVEHHIITLADTGTST